MYKVDRRLYLDSKGKKIVEGPPEAARLFKAKGGPVTPQELDTWGKKIKRYIPELQKDEVEEKKKEKPKDKQRTPAKNKSASGGEEK